MRKSLSIASALVVIGLAAVALALAKPASAADQLTISSYGGAYQSSLRKAYFEPFAKTTGIKITEDEFNGEIAKIRAMVESKTVSWDVVDIDPGQVVQLCADGTIQTIDWKNLGLDRAKILGSDEFDCGVPYVVAAQVIAYDKDKLLNGPKTIADFFDTQKFPGKRGLQNDPRCALEWALIADGAPVKDVYRMLGTPAGVDRAFKKLDTIKKDVVWWKSNAQPPQLLADGQVVMTSALNGRIYDAVKNSGKRFEIMWDAQVWEWGVWAIPQGSPHREAAYKFLAFVGSPQAQADLTLYIPYGPTNKDALALVNPAMLPHLPTAADHMGNAVQNDAAFWGEKGDELRQRFTAWLAK
ncbi:spermidine/putrescine ABC transporter substrate-binding protein [Bradyrhizobium pachyrhizi]|uniref:polyamine ABC transporter substrate-binding protein n=1 Tax=Bradyrhizobium pachyrhizi TaxID=280333 RepID=UPI000704A2BD|nr:ABC transporter substrate-binding protein [Bradyrhizobium pachyrhizi]KRP93128.1 spermidine/putrescine ABC transporter substrate-binding protein [Bradyrhizobium pachyrhizi]